MNNITLETKLESYYNELGKRANRYKQIIEILLNKRMTAKEVAIEMYNREYSLSSERNVSAPRLNELVNLGIAEVIGKKKCQYTKKNVAIYALKEEHKEDIL